MKKKIIITGGHFTPAIALIEEIKKSQGGWEIFYFGTKRVVADSKQDSFEFETMAKIKNNASFLMINSSKIKTLNILQSRTATTPCSIPLERQMSSLIDKITKKYFCFRDSAKVVFALLAITSF